MQNNDVKFIEFNRRPTPQPIERKQGNGDDKPTYWGEDNLYPNFLLQLYGEVPLHQSITTSKVDYLIGDGLVTKSDGKLAKFDISISDSLEEIVQKITFDYVIFNFFAVEVQYNLLNKPFRFNHIPAHFIRANKSKTKFWVCDDWQAKKQVLTYDRWIRGQNEDGKSKVFFYQGYVPSANNVYPEVKYKSAITSMVTEMLVNDFNKNSLEDGFSAAHIISFFKGIPTSDDARQFEKKFGERYSGVNGLKYIINYNNTEDKGVAVDSIASEDYASKLVEVNKKIETNILTAHQITSPIMFGIKTEGQLGGATEIETAYELFKNIYVKNNRNIIETGLNKLFSDAGIETVEFKDKTNLFTTSLDATTRQKVLTIDELRALDGKTALTNGEGLKLIGSTTSTTATSSLTKFTLSKTDERYKTGRILVEEDFESVKHLGTSKSDFSILDTAENFKSAALQFDDDKDIENYLMDNDLDGKTLTEIKAAIRKDLGIAITVADLEIKISKLTDAGIIESDVKDGKVNKIKSVDKGGRTVEVMYDYQVKVGYGAPLISTSRGFCVKLIENDRLYTREDIQTMSSIFGYDVFTHSGGWYTNPDTGNAENQCRHQWVMQRVIKKQANA
ncbi:hypothetical protein FPZ42_07640 [Mucilaginibacter achroorhodeus]|uniref:Phage portal protein n=1 Tax=Mucilaginibacter achroorhodeus TaxID=2599294 RepID=A0A563U6C9_9SPHI|nr:hypothetical protein [Mucilaginibacter achroorhodeus]TWR26898.1 hypothetical protein FPZ42_07640 [Mucilaginibacter achroorhodeus]